MEAKGKRSQVDIVNTILEDCIVAFPISSFVISLYQQYQKRGFLTRKQLEGLHNKASKIPDLAPGKLATLEALIKKMPTRFKSELPKPNPILQKDNVAGDMINQVLEKYPQHKRVLYLKSKYENNEALSSTELADLRRFAQLLNRKS